MTPSLSKDLTSYDLLKCAAIVLMIVDHTGGFFFPGEEWWRAVGRLSAPIWLFLIGYARSRDISPRLWVGALVLIMSGFFIGPSILPMNILVTIIVIRLVLDRAARYMLSDSFRFMAAGAVLFFATPVTWFFLDYGSAGLTVALFGYMLRRRGEDPRITKDGLEGWGIFTAASFVLITLYAFGNFEPAQKYFVMGALPLVFYGLGRFRPAVYPDLTKNLGVLAPLVRLGGRRSLEIYVLHLLAFKIAACAMEIEGMGLFEWRWY